MRKAAEACFAGSFFAGNPMRLPRTRKPGNKKPGFTGKPGFRKDVAKHLQVAGSMKPISKLLAADIHLHDYRTSPSAGTNGPFGDSKRL